MPWSQLPPETVKWIQDSITEVTEWLMGNIREVYINGPLGSYLPSEFEDALNHAVNGLNSAWMIDSSKKAKDILDRFPGLEDRFPGLGGGELGGSSGGDWTGIITRPPTWSGNADKIISGAINPFTNFVYAIQNSRLRQYWNLYYSGYIDKGELLAWSGARSMEHFFQVAGADPNFVTPLRQQRENGQITDAKLQSLMGLDSMDQVNKILGWDWRMRLDMKESLARDGFNLTMDESKILTDAYINDLRNNMTRPDAQLLEGLAGKMNDIGLGELPLEYRSYIVNGTLNEAAAIIADGTEGIAAFFSDLDSLPMLASNAFVVDVIEPDFTPRDKKAVSVEPTFNTNLIQSNIALAMRQVEGENGSVGSFYTESQSSFGSLSLASPFEENASGKAHRVA